MKENVVRNLTKFTADSSPKNAVDLLHTVMFDYAVESFEDYSQFCFLLARCARAMIISEQSYKEQGFDDTAFQNLKKIAEHLDAASDLFIDCDPYYR